MEAAELCRRALERLDLCGAVVAEPVDKAKETSVGESPQAAPNEHAHCDQRQFIHWHFVLLQKILINA